MSIAGDGEIDCMYESSASAMRLPHLVNLKLSLMTSDLAHLARCN